MLNYNLFQATENPLVIYNRQPILDIGFEFFYEDCDGVEVDFDFPNYSSAFVRFYNERLGRLIKTFVPTLSGNVLVLNTTDTTFEDNGNYYYEVGYVQSGGYEIVLRYGILEVK